MSRALGEYMITGIKTTIPFQEAIMRDPDFVRGKYNTGFVPPNPLIRRIQS
jgi:pyruvate carboxylase